MSYKLNKKIIINGQIEAITGMAIGGSNTAMGIGGVDKPIVRNPITKEPYIPGSSLKGKMRSLLEMKNGHIFVDDKSQIKYQASREPNQPTTKLFGNATGNDDQKPSRIIVRDAKLSDKQMKNGKEVEKLTFFKETELLFTEVKTEVVIDRITSKAMPRQMERVPPGARFDFELILNIFQGENEIELIKDTFAALQLVQNDYVGGSGSRGSGQVAFHINNVLERTAIYYELNGQGEENKTAAFTQYFPK